MAKKLFRNKMFLANLSAVFALGIVSQILQIVLLRELLMVFHGNELSLGIILAAWMFWVGTGSRIGSSFAENFSKHPTVLGVNASAVAIVSFLSVFLTRMLRGFFSVEPGGYFSVFDMTLACIIIMAPVGLLLGIQFVMLAKVWRESDGAEDTSGAEKTYIGEASGNIVGGLLFSFYLVHLFNSFHIVVFSGILLVTATIWLGARVDQQLMRLPDTMKPAIWGLLILLMVSAVFLSNVDKWTHTKQWKMFSPEYRLVETRQSKYGAISVAQLENQFSFFQSGNLIFSTAGPDAKTPALEEQEGVVFAHFAMVQHPEPAHVLVIGGGLRGTVREMAKHPIRRIDYIELDPVLTDTAMPYLNASTIDALKSPLVNLIHTDGRLFIKTTNKTYDIIIVDIPDPATAVLNRYYTEEFFHEARSRLKPDGIFVTGVVSTPDMRGEAVANRNATIYHTLRRVFPVVYPAGQRFLFFFAGNKESQLSADLSILEERFLRRHVLTDGFSHRHFELLLEQSQLRRINWIIRNHGRTPDAHLGSPDTGPLFPETVEEQHVREADLPPVNNRFFINSDFKPIGYYYTLRLWDVLTRTGHGDTFKWIMKVEPHWILPAVIMCLVVPLAVRSLPSLRKTRADEHFAVLLAVFTTGVSTMSLQVALIFSFQSLYGFVYEMIGLITALFMGGLALGTYMSRKTVKQKANRNVLALIQFLIAWFALVVAFGLPRAATLDSPGMIVAFIASMTFFCGVFNGADFPLTAACCHALTQNPEKATGVVYGVELFGACAGALIASIVIAPVLGIAAVGILAAIANFTAFLCLIVARKYSGS